MRAILLTKSIKTNVTPETKSDFQLLAVSRGVKPATLQRDAFRDYIKTNASKIKRLRASQKS